MGRPIETTGIWVHAQTAPCANHCRYCQVNEKKVANITFTRYRFVLDRFVEWKQVHGLADFHVGQWVGRAHNYDTNTLKGVMELTKREGWRLDSFCWEGFFGDRMTK